MSFKTAQFIAWRYIRGSRTNKNTNTLTKVCFLGIFIGTLCLSLEIFIMSGFEKAISEKMQSIYPQITLDAPFDSSFDLEKAHKHLIEKYPIHINAIAPAHSKRIIVQSLESNDASAVYLKAIDPILEQTVSSIGKKLQRQTLPLTEVLADKKIIIGKTLAHFFDVKEGDTISLLFTQTDEFNTQELSYTTHHVTIGGIFETGIVQYDKYLIICSFELMDELLGERLITQLGMQLQPGAPEETIMKELEKTFNGEANSWKTLYPALVSASKLEKYVMFFLLGLIALIASTNLISLLFMHITNKRTDIAILKTLGMRDIHILYIFVFMGFIITTIATLSGLAGAFFVGFFLQRYPFIKLPDVYYVTHLPIHMEWTTFILVFTVVIILSFIATLFSARYAQTINITRTLRFDG